VATETEPHATAWARTLDFPPRSSSGAALRVYCTVEYLVKRSRERSRKLPELWSFASGQLVTRKPTKMPPQSHRGTIAWDRKEEHKGDRNGGDLGMSFSRTIQFLSKVSADWWAELPVLFLPLQCRHCQTKQGLCARPLLLSVNKARQSRTCHGPLVASHKIYRPFLPLSSRAGEGRSVGNSSSLRPGAPLQSPAAGAAHVRPKPGGCVQLVGQRSLHIPYAHVTFLTNPGSCANVHMGQSSLGTYGCGKRSVTRTGLRRWLTATREGT
jgi:hypothetical protein